MQKVIGIYQVERLENEAYHTVAVVRGLLLRKVFYQFAGQPVFSRIVIVKDAQYVQEG